MQKKKMKIDPLTGEEFLPKKVTQRFKNRANQIKYNNKRQSQRRIQLGITTRPLHKTHRILDEALGKANSKKIHREWLKGAGADMTLITHIERIGEKKFHAIFNFTIVSDGDYYIISKILDYENRNM